MAQAVVDFGEREDRVLTIVKGKYGFKNKSQAINFVISKFEKEFLEPELRPEYERKIKRIIVPCFEKFVKEEITVRKVIAKAGSITEDSI